MAGRRDIREQLKKHKNSRDSTAPAWPIDPDPNQPFSGDAAITSVVHTTSRTVAAYALDTMKFGRMWELTGGLR